MAENTIDTLSLEINSNAGRAVDSLDRLAGSILKLKNSLGGGWIGDMQDLSINIGALSDATKKLDTGKITGFASALGKLSGSVTALATASGDLTPAIKNLQKLSAFDFSRLNVSGDFSGLFSLARGMGALADAAPRLASLKSAEINRTLKAFQKIGSVDFTSTVQSLQALNGVDTSGFVRLTQAMNGFADSAGKLAALKTADISRAVKSFERLASLNISGLAAGLRQLNGVDLSKLAELGTAFQGFASALSQSEKIANGTQKIFSSLAQLAASAGNIPTITANLPELSSELYGFMSVMSTAPAVEAGTVSLVTALASLANAGGKALKTSAALPELTEGVRSFIQVLSTMPRLDSNILRAVEALAQLANAGGRAGSASRDLQRNIDRLSGSMGSFRYSVLNVNGGLRSFAGQLLAALGITGGIYGLVRAIKASVTEASDLTEVQNVVDVTFGDMAQKVEELSKVSIRDFGMSELTAKQISSRFQAMGVAMGFAQDEMSDMSIELTKLAADMASFYNVEQEAVAESLSAIFTGQTRPLRQYGLDLTEATLQEWAMKQGIDANMKSMSQAEKTLLRYRYVLANTTAAQGDFARTSGTSWANQVRILTEQFRQLGAILGGGLMAALMPVVKGINVLMAKIIQLASTLSAFLGKLFGIKKATAGGGAGLAGIADTAGLVADNTEAAAGGIADAGNAAKKAGEKMASFAAGWHEVTSMSSNESGEAGGSGGAGGVSMPDMSLPAEYEMEVTADDQVSPVLEGIKKRFEELAGLFIKGFRIGLGDTSVFDSIRNNLLRIKTSLLDIFADGTVIRSFNHLLDTLVYNAGLKAGAFVSVGATIADNLTGGLALYLESAKDRIRKWIISMLDITGDVDTIKAGFMVAVADIFTVFRSDDAKQITADIIQVFSDAFMNVTLLAGKLGRDILGLLLNPITENAEGFREALQNTLSPVSEILGTIADSFTSLWATVQQTYDAHARPTFEALTSGISEIVETLLRGYNEHIAPVLSALATRFTEVWQGTIQPLLENFIGLLGDVGDFVTSVWNGVFQPVINWIVTAILPVVSPVLAALGNAFFTVFETIGGILGGFVTSCRGVLQFLSGTFSGDWSKMWTGIKTVFKGIWDMFPDFVKEPIRAIIGAVNQMIKGIEGGINFAIRMLNKLSFDIPDWVPEVGGKTFGFNLSEVFLPLIPQLAKGGVLKKATLALVGESGKEAVLPLDRNTGWMSDLSGRISENIKRDFGDLKLDYSIPEPKGFTPRYSDADMGRLKTTIQMEMDEKMAQMAYENRQLRDAVEQNTQILEKILAQGIVLDDNTFTSKYKSASSKFYKQHRYEMGLYPAGR